MADFAFDVNSETHPIIMEIVVKMLFVILTSGLVVSVVTASSSSSSDIKSLLGLSSGMDHDVHRRSLDTNPDQQTEEEDGPVDSATGNSTDEEVQSTLPLEITSDGEGKVQVLSNNDQCATDVDSIDPDDPNSEEDQQRKRTVDSKSLPKDHLRHHSAKRCRRQAESKAAGAGAAADEKLANDKKLADDKSAGADAASKAEMEKMKHQDEEQDQEQQEQQQQQQAREQKNEAKSRRDFDSPRSGQALETGEEEKQEAKARRGDEEKADSYSKREETEKSEDAAATEIRERKAKDDDDDDDGEELEEENFKVNRRDYASSKGRKQRRDFEFDPPMRRRSPKRRRGDDDDDGDRSKRYLRGRRNEDDDSYRQRRYDTGDDFYRAERESSGQRHDDQGWRRGRRHSAGERGDGRGDRVRFWRSDGGGREASLGEADLDYMERKARDDDDDGFYLERKARDDDDDGAYLERKMRDDDDDGAYLERRIRDDDDDGAYLERKMRDDDDDGAYLERKMRDDDDDGVYLERKIRGDDDDDGAYLERKMRGGDDDDDGAYLERKMRYADDDDGNYLNMARSARHSGHEASENELRSARDDDESKVKRLKPRGVQHGGGGSDTRGKRDDDDDGNKAIRRAAADEGVTDNKDAKWLRGLRSSDRRAKQIRKARLSNSNENSKGSGASGSDRKRRGDKESLAVSASGSFLNADAASVRGMRYIEDGVKTERAADGKDERKKRLFGILDDYIPGRKRAVGGGESELRQSKVKGRNREKRQATFFDQSYGPLNLKTSESAGETDFKKTLEFDEKVRGRKRRSLSMEVGKIMDPEGMLGDQKKAKMKSSESEALKKSMISTKVGQAK